MTSGRLIAVVGPSGVGKDSLMRGIHEANPDMHLVRRVITRDENAGGEAFDAVGPVEFRELAQNGAFAIHWKAHGLEYGIPITVKYQLNRGTDCLANFSRKALAEASEKFPRLLVLNVTARADTLAHRLATRARETETEIAQRLEEAQKSLPEHLRVINLSNDGPLDETVARAVALLQPENV